MAPRIMGQQLLYLSSVNRLTGTPDNFNVALPNGILQNEWQGKTKIVVVDCIINRCFWSVRSSNNSFSIVKTNASLVSTIFQTSVPVGNYTIQSWMATLSTVLIGWTMTHNYITGICTFQPPNDSCTYSLTFQDKSSFLFGFNTTDIPTGSFSNPIISNFPLKLNLESFINVHHNLPRTKNSSVANYRQTEIKENDVLIRMAVNVPSFANIVYENKSDDFGFYIAATHVNQLHLYITDENKDQISPFPYDWSITLKIIYESKDDMDELILDKLKQMDEKLQYLAIK